MSYPLQWISAGLLLLLTACGSSGGGTEDADLGYQGPVVKDNPQTGGGTGQTGGGTGQTGGGTGQTGGGTGQTGGGTGQTDGGTAQPVTQFSLNITQLDFNEGQRARIQISLSSTSPLTQRFDYRLIPATAFADRDYQEVSGQIEFKPGEQTKQIQIPFLADNDEEKNESFLIEFTGDTLANRVQGGSLQIRDQPRVIAANLTDIRLSALQTGQVQPLTYGQWFAPGQLKKAEQLGLINSQQQSQPVQIDVKARHPDGSIRHAIVSSLKAANDTSSNWYLVEQTTEPSKTSSPSALELLKQRQIDGKLQLKLGDQNYQLDLQQALSNSQTKKQLKHWLQGPVVNEWLFSAPLLDAEGKAHPHLMARFELRIYQDYQPIRLSVSLENNWTYVDNPGNQQYNLSFTLAGEKRLSESGLLHNHHSRWRKVFWTGQGSEAIVTPDLAKLLKSGAVPSYDYNLTIQESTLKSYADALNQSDSSERFGLMGTGLLNYKMGTTGARAEIGPLPAWTAAYLISGDERARQLMLEHANLAGSWPIHYRDEKTDLPVSVADYPYITLLGNRGDTFNPETKAYEALPACDLKGRCQAVNRRFWSKMKDSTATELVGYASEADSAHQPSQAYIPYLITGDYYYLEELQFWTNFNLLQTNPHYRGKDKGLVTGQVRGMAWDLRALGEAAYISPDDHPLKAFYRKTLDNNAEFFKQSYADKASDYPLGYLPNLAYGFVISPWMDDFFTWSVGQLVNQGFSNWQPVLNWKARFPVGRMTDPGFCWVLASAYHINAMPGDEKTLKILDPTPYKTFAQLYQGLLENPAYSNMRDQSCASQDMASALTETNKARSAGQFYVQMQVGEMVGYDGTYAGYSANLQPALAVSVHTPDANAKKAWQRFMQRPKKDNGYSESPQFAIIPLP